MRNRTAAAIVLLALAGPCAAALELGTLFTTPEERARLDRLRRGEPEGAAPEANARGAPAPSLTGFVKRSDGRNTVWIDGVPVPVSRPGSGQLLEPHAVGPAPRDDDTVRIERKTPR